MRSAFCCAEEDIFPISQRKETEICNKKSYALLLPTFEMPRLETLDLHIKAGWQEEHCSLYQYNTSASSNHGREPNKNLQEGPSLLNLEIHEATLLNNLNLGDEQLWSTIPVGLSHAWLCPLNKISSQYLISR